MAALLFRGHFRPSPEPFPKNLEMIRVDGHSMEPRLWPDQWVRHHKGYYEDHPVRRNDIVTFRLTPQSPLFVKRVLAVAGDRVEIRNNRLFINGEVIRNLRGFEYITKSDYFKALLNMARTVPDENILVMGEAYKGSRDSSEFGFLPEKSLVGKVLEY